MGGTAGALVRYAMATTWPKPQDMLIPTLIAVGVAFFFAAYVLATGLRTSLHYLILGLCGGVASLSAWAVLTISTPMRLSLAFLTLTPVAAVTGLLCGLVVARAVAR
ncbi:Putative fluoride ion transporter CrcB [Mycolicibacterium parafortuitum]|uniref:Fluoride ion transporter CrcB n=1 Tax=Mycolicibacterium parafortuitum TaxID=39692 RepID=A0A375YHT4_MYCPF|nr:Putative fluoride ion transporter CrcB [Mycolicibacterium parafortuitum]